MQLKITLEIYMDDTMREMLSKFYIQFVIKWILWQNTVKQGIFTWLNVHWCEIFIILIIKIFAELTYFITGNFHSCVRPAFPRYSASVNIVIDIKKLQRIQDIAAKIVTQSGKYDSSTAARKALHWLPIQQRIDFKVCTLVFRSLHGMAPGYLADLLKPEQSRKPGLRSQNTTGVLHVPFTRRKTFADRSFSVFGPKTWNSLPNTLRTNMDYGKFRSGLKAHLFAKAYPE